MFGGLGMPELIIILVIILIIFRGRLNCRRLVTAWVKRSATLKSPQAIKARKIRIKRMKLKTTKTPKTISETQRRPMIPWKIGRFLWPHPLAAERFEHAGPLHGRLEKFPKSLLGQTGHLVLKLHQRYRLMISSRPDLMGTIRPADRSAWARWDAITPSPIPCRTASITAWDTVDSQYDPWVDGLLVEMMPEPPLQGMGPGLIRDEVMGQQVSKRNIAVQHPVPIASRAGQNHLLVHHGIDAVSP
jgi:Sec-independent protein translocase protein TatA